MSSHQGLPDGPGSTEQPPCVPAISALLKGGVTFYQETQWGYKALPIEPDKAPAPANFLPWPGDDFQSSSATALLTRARRQQGLVRTIQHVAGVFRFLKTEVTAHKKEFNAKEK